MELKWLEDFLALARTGSFSRAASLRNVTQPALSRRIRALEDWIGVPLIDRSSYPVALTPLGKQFLPNAEEMARQANGLRDDFRLLHRPPGTAIRILSLHTLSTTLVPEILAGFCKAEPKVTVTMTANLQGVDDHFDALTTGTVDFLFTYGHIGVVERAVREGALDYLTLAREEFLPVATPERLKAWGPSPLQRERGMIPFLSCAAPSFSERLVMPVARRYARQLRVIYEDTLNESVRAMALKGAGLAWLPSHMVAGDLASGRLAVLEEPHLRIPFEIRVYRAADLRSQKAQQLWSYIAERSAGSGRIRPEPAGAAVIRPTPETAAD